MDSRVIIPALLVFGAALIQQTPLAVWGGIRINLILIILLVCVFIARGFAEYAIFTASAFLGSAMTLPWDRAAAALAAVALCAYASRRSLPWQSWVQYLLMLVVGTVFLYGLIDWHFLIREPLIVEKELFYTLVGGSVAYFYAARWYEKRTGRTF
jgi:hypothetical protein